MEISKFLHWKSTPKPLGQFLPEISNLEKSAIGIEKVWKKSEILSVYQNFAKCTCLSEIGNLQEEIKLNLQEVLFVK